MDVFRITERFKVTGRGTVYTIKISKGAVLHINDILCDLCGNRFMVKSIEMIRRLIIDISPEDQPVGIMLELLSGREVSGNILVRDLTEINFLFCNHPLYPRKVDEDYKAEYQAAGLDHACALFSYEEFSDGKLMLYGEEISGLTVYRGWMMKPEMYRDLYAHLEERGIILINTPEEYERYHLLPGWYGEFADETSETVWASENDIEDVMQLAQRLEEGSYIVKDYVKSRKHEWYDACFIKNIRDKALVRKVVGNFIERQGEDLVGSVVLRKFENLKKTGFHEQSGMPLSEEYRVFVYAGRVLAIDNYWNKDAGVPFTEEEYAWIESIADRVKSNFVTVDLARKEDGSLIIMEFGDGQVSGLQQLKAEEFYRIFRGQGIFYRGWNGCALTRTGGIDMNLPENIAALTAGKDYRQDDIGMSGSKIMVFDDSVLKIVNYREENNAAVQMMRWLEGKIPVPKVICYETDEKYQYLLMSRVEGKMSCDPYWLEHPKELLSLLSEAIQMLWSVDITDCPRNRDLDAELAEAEYRVRNHLVDMDNVEPTTFGANGEFADPEQLLAWLRENRPVYEPVLSHGDFCLPNIFLDKGKVCGFIDLGDTGVGDKWRDIALCYRSLKHNFGGRYGGKAYPDFRPEMLFEKLGIEPDWEKLRYYILLDELF